jgi:nucleoside phosphorylase
VLLIAATERELTGLEGLGEGRPVCGVGPVDAGVATARALEQRAPRAVLHLGLAGAHGFTGPELVLGSEALYCDTDSVFVAARVLPDSGLLEAARAALPDVRVCPIGTSARVGGSSGCEVEAMEGFAVLRAAELAAVPALELRAVSNLVDEPDRARWRFEDALAALRAALPAVLRELGA